MNARNRTLTCIVTLLLALLLTGCWGLPFGSPTPASPTEASTQIPDLAYTQAAETIIADLTANPPPAMPTSEGPPDAPAMPSPTDELLPPTSTPLPTDTPVPTEPPVPTDTPLPSDTPLPTESPTPTSPPEPTLKIVFQDDFSNASGGWPTIDLDSVEGGYGHGGYYLTNMIKEDMAWSTRSPQFDNTRVELVASLLSGPMNSGYYGLICRFTNGGNYYFMGVGSDGWYGIAKRVSNQMEYLEEGYDTASIIHTGKGVNQIQGDCIDNKLNLWVNGEKIAQVEDNTFSAGGIGLGVGTRSDFAYAVVFDDFVLSLVE